ncbi:hypothetical protein, partial [Burkholderia cenocepacia]|uniref:hypothetical protein n=1 Tax=Burkholderia cenocepacia TaxID=95486 RepID=UPI0024B7273A
ARPIEGAGYCAEGAAAGVAARACVPTVPSPADTGDKSAETGHAAGDGTVGTQARAATPAAAPSAQ